MNCLLSSSAQPFLGSLAKRVKKLNWLAQASATHTDLSRFKRDAQEALRRLPFPDYRYFNSDGYFIAGDRLPALAATEDAARAKLEESTSPDGGGEEHAD